MQRNRTILAILTLGDWLTICISFWLAYAIRFVLLDYPAVYDARYYIQLIALNSILWVGLFWINRLYSTKILFGGLEEYTRAVSAVTMGAVLLVLSDFFLERDLEISRGWLLLVWLLSLALIILFRFSVRHGVYALHRRGHLLVPAVIVGADEEGQELLSQLKQFQHSGLQVRGFIDNHRKRGTVVSGDCTVLGSGDEIMQVVTTYGIEEVIIASGSLNREELLNIYRSVAWNPGVKLRLTSGMFEIISTGLYIKELANIPLIEVNKVRITGIGLTLKTIADYSAGLLGILLLSPLFLLVAILICLDTPGPIFYKHRVLGLHGKQFLAYKFRTMVKNSQEVLKTNPELQREFNENFKLKDDPRVTRVGRYLRRTSLDELPQLINILRGEMSLVGPRFITPEEMPRFGKWGMNLLTVKPGMTGLWQVSGRSDTSYEERVRLDMHYIRNWNLGLDLYLILITIPATLKQKGAY